MPAIAPVVTPWARAGLIDIEDNAAAAPRAQLNRTNQRMGGPPRRGSKIGIVVPIETGEKVFRARDDVKDARWALYAADTRLRHRRECSASRPAAGAVVSTV